jgi:hypothetical protein
MFDDLPEIKQETVILHAKEESFGWWARLVNRTLKWLYNHWDDSIVYFDVEKKVEKSS